MNCTAIILAYNNSHLFEKCLHSLSSQSHQLNQLLTINNNASFPIEQLLQRLLINQQTKTQTISSNSNLGSAGGFALGIQAAHQDGAEWIWLHDEDDFPEYNCLERLLSHPHGSIRAPQIKDPVSGKVLHYFKRSQGRLGYFHPSQTNQILIAGTAGLLIHRDVISAIGSYDPTFFVGYEDYDFCLRAAKAGFKIAVVEDAIVYHPDHQSNFTSRHKWIEPILSYLPSFWGVMRSTTSRDYYTIRNYIIISKRHKSRSILMLEMLTSLCILPLFKLFDHRVLLKETLKTYFEGLCAA